MFIFTNNKCRFIGLVGLLVFICSFSPLAVQAQTYCTPTIPSGCATSGAFPAGHWITSVQLGTINDNPSNSNCTIYDHTNLSTDITAGVSTAMTVQIGGFLGVGVYVDFNNDGDFDDIGEFLYGAYTAGTTYNFNITVPLSVSQGIYRMRVLGMWAWAGAAGDACAIFPNGDPGYGNFYDYYINVIQPCPTITGSTATPAIVCYGEASQLSASASISGSIYYWYSSATGGSAIDSGSTYQTPALTHNTTYYVSAKYNGCESDPRTPVLIKVRPALPAPLVSPADTMLCSGSVATLQVLKGTALDTVTIGTGTIGDVVAPINVTQSYSKSQLIYTQAEIGMNSFPRIITGISFYKTQGTAGAVAGNVQIYMSYTNASIVGATMPNLAPGSTTYTLVYSGPMPNGVGANSWVTIPLTTPFPGPGTLFNQNLSIIVLRENQTPNPFLGPRYAYTNVGANLCGYNSGATPTGNALTQTFNRPNIKLAYSFQPDVSWNPFGGLFKDNALTIPLTAADTNTTVYTNQSGTYQVHANWLGCLSASSTSLVTLLPPIAPATIDTTICNGESYVFGNQTYTVSTNLTDTFQSVHGCDSVVGLNLTVLPAAVSTTDTITGCWFIVHNGQTYTSSTLLSDTLHFVGYGCDSAYVNTYLLIHPVDTQSLMIDTAGCSSVVFEGQTYTSSQAFLDTISNQYGCDSVYRHIHITVYPPIAPATIDTTICNGESYVFGGQAYTVSTNLTDTFQSVHGCDSIVSLNLTVLPAAVSTTDTIEGCWSMVQNGQTYTSSTLLSDTLHFADYGCDSAYLNTYLWVHAADTQSLIIDTAGCSSVVFEGQTYTSSQALLDTIDNQYGCDSIYRHIHISVYPPIASSLIDTTICNGESYVFGSQTYTVSTTLTDTFPSAHGCDSVVGLNLTVLPAAVSTTDTVTGCWSIVHNGQTYTSSTLLSDTLHFAGYGCDSAYVNTYLWVHAADTQSLIIDTAGCSSVVFEGQTYTSSQALLDTISNQYGCDSIYRHIHITVYPPIASSLIDTTICNGESYVFGSQTYTVSTTLTDTFPSAHGCDSVVGLNLTVLPAAVSTTDTVTGCWSIVQSGQTYTSSTLLSDTLHFAGYGCDSAYLNTYLLIHPVDTQSLIIDTAGCSSVAFEGQTYTSSQALLDTISNQYGCDSIYRHIHITVYPPVAAGLIDTTICNGESFTFNGQSYSQTITLTDTFQSVHGCDSVVGLNLTVLPAVVSATDTIEGCWSMVHNGQTYTSSTLLSDTLHFAGYGCDSAYVNTYLWVHAADTQSVTIDTAGCSSVIFNGQTYTQSTTALDTISNQYGCDSVYRHIHITVYPPVAAGLIDTTICNGESFTFNGQSYSQTITLTDTFQSVHGCDSVVELNLTVLPAVVSATDTIEACWSIVHNGQTYTSSTLLSDTLHFVGYGCDSAYVNTYLWVHAVDTQSLIIDTAGCSSVVFEGQTYTSSQALLDTIDNQYGCDSIYRHIHITVYPPVAAGLIDTTICNGESFVFGGQAYTVSTTLADTFQSVHGCDSVVALNLTVLPAAVSATDTIEGCWSLVQNGQTYTSSTLLSDTLHFADYGCDSAYLNTYLWVHAADTQSVTIDTAGCSSVVFEGQTYTSSQALLDTIDNQYGCDSVYRHINITVYNTTVIQRSKDTVACDELNLMGHTYYQNAIIDTIYKSVHGCDSLQLKVRVFINHSVRDTIHASICRGESYLFDGQEYKNTGVYSATYPYWNGCDSISVLELQVHELPNVTVDIIEPPVQFCQGNPVVLQAGGALSYHWLTDYGKDYGEGDSMRIIMVKPDIAVMTIGKDNNGCVDTTITNLHAEPCCTMFMPNAFSPNGDGNNDLFGPGANGSFTEYRLEIYDRYGKRIFVSFNKNSEWDGTIGGQPAIAGTYFYRVTAKCMNGSQLVKQGDLTLIR